MIIISHRGCWKKPDEKNTIQAFINSVNLGFGCETDIRDHNSRLVVSHDVPHANSFEIDPMLELFENRDLLLAINIKADGLQELLQASLKRYHISKYFVFDMSVPETKKYINLGFNVFGRQSEYEPDIAFYDNLKGIWLDAFESVWYDVNLINRHLLNGKQVCLVSSELHHRNYSDHWKFLKSSGIIKNDDLILCTDLPEDARIYFNT